MVIDAATLAGSAYSACFQFSKLHCRKRSGKACEDIPFFSHILKCVYFSRSNFTLLKKQKCLEIVLNLNCGTEYRSDSELDNSKFDSSRFRASQGKLKIARRFYKVTKPILNLFLHFSLFVLSFESRCLNYQYTRYLVS